MNIHKYMFVISIVPRRDSQFEAIIALWTWRVLCLYYTTGRGVKKCLSIHMEMLTLPLWLALAMLWHL